MIKRLWIYLSEMYPPGQRLVMAAVLFFGPYFALTLLAHENKQSHTIVTWSALAGFLSYFLFLLMLRISDEFKDFELDCRLFPGRPLPSGRVHSHDLKKLGWACVVGLICLNTLVAPFTLGFAVIMLYAGLMFKFFFMKERIQKSLVLALLTHNPIIFLMTFYTSCLVAADVGSSPLGSDFLKVGILFALPGLIWELSRKIKAPQDENDYETYSQVFGYRLAATNPAILYALHFGLTYWLSKDLPLSNVYLAALGLGALVAMGFSLRFIISPNSKTAQLRPAAEVYVTIASLGFICDLIVARGLLWAL
jgi:4-hydroxybenzoate polyprenyltransferase